jgi:hypothetical protein
MHLDFFQLNAKKPQVKVIVDGIPALCPSMNCDYLYTDIQSIITSQSIDGLTITFQAQNLLADLGDHTPELTFAGIKCVVQGQLSDT